MYVCVCAASCVLCMLAAPDASTFRHWHVSHLGMGGQQSKRKF